MQNQGLRAKETPAIERVQARTSLEAYFREVGTHRLLSAQQEIDLAREIEKLDLQVWDEILSQPSTVEHNLRLIEASLENSIRPFRSLRKAAALARKLRNKEARDALAAASRRAGRRLRIVDLDGVLRDTMLADLRRLGRGEQHGLSRAQLGFDPGSQRFADYLGRIEKAVQAAMDARAEFVNANLRLVVTVARRYSVAGLPFADLIQEGNIGLMKAVNRFDHRRGLRFSTYATWWIRHTVGRAVAEKARTIRLPVHLADSRQRIARVRRELSSSLGREPSREEVARAAALPVQKVEIIEERLPEAKVSLDEPVGEDGDRSRMDVIRSGQDSETTPFDALASKTTRAIVTELLETLKPMEADIVRQRFGLDGDGERTLQQVANKYGLSRERIRQIQQEAFTKLRRALRSKGLH